MKKRKICIITGSRADYGHLRSLIRAVQEDRDLHLQLVVTGSHLSSDFGMTWKEIAKDGFSIAAKVGGLISDGTEQGVTLAMARGIRSFVPVFSRLSPDLVVILGDRYEIFAATLAAYTLKLPLAHIHGGETTEGALDEGFRHAITKMSSFHFAATEEYRRRIIQMGESPRRTFCFGAPGLDMVCKTVLLSRQELSDRLGLDLSSRLFLVTFHTATLENKQVLDQVRELLCACEKFKGVTVFTKANADAGGSQINKALAQFCLKHKGKAVLIDNLGSYLYWSLMASCDVMIGNSSSALIEAPSFRTPAVNIGIRQQGRVRAKNVIDVPCSRSAIIKAVHRAMTPAFRRSLRTIKNPYAPIANRKAGVRIKQCLKNMKLADVLTKHFVDIPFRVGAV